MLSDPRFRRDDDPVDSTVPSLTAADVVAQIERCLAGGLSAGALAAWAFDRFYAVELGTVSMPADEEDAIVEALDSLMFGDTPEFNPTEDELRRLAVRLSEL